MLNLLLLAAPAFGQFKVFPSIVEMAEGGKVNLLVIISGRQKFTLRQPPGFTVRVDAPNKSLLFKSANEKTAITFQVTTNFPGELPAQEVLRSKALEETPGGGILQTSFCPTGYKPGCFFDLVRLMREGLSVRYRRVYVACPEGTLEFVFATDNSEFEGQRFIFSNFLNSFRLEPATSASLDPAKP